MKKKLLSVLLSVALISTTLVGCGSSDSGSGTATTETPAVTEGTTTEDTTEETTSPGTASEASENGYEIALVTDLGTVDDKSFNQGAWEGVAQYGNESGVSYKYYQPQEAATAAYLETMALAIEGGAKIIVCPGFLFEEPVYLAQEQYPDINFILLDGEPHSADYSDFHTADNTMAILFKEDQSGYLAGYAAVKEGYTNLGFMGGMAVPAVIRFGYGFVQGAEAAAVEMGVDISMMYHYTGEFVATPEAQAMAASWYQSGTEVIFACGGAVGNSVMAAAEAEDKKVIGVDVDQSIESDTVILSALKMLSVSIYDGVKAHFEGNFPGGTTSVFTAENNGVGLPMDTTQLEVFTVEDYDVLYAKLATNEIALVDSIEDGSTADLTVANTTIKFVD
ncbi:MAG: BMP family ABC transporter substrate-binding protein [Eubacteriales bacterium]